MEITDEDAKAARITSLREMRDHLRQQLASLDKESALVENELASLQGSPGAEGAHLPIEERITCKHSCAHHAALMDPAIWRNLPGEVLQMVFARLPLRQIVSLQCLSKAWRWNVTAKESGFRRLCASAGSSKPKMFALADETMSNEKGGVSIKLFDAEAQKWHVFEITLQPWFYCETMSACDGGLVCFVSRMLREAANPLRIVVLNPLTKEYKVLPALTSLNKVQPQMVQLIMDRETKCYKVIVVGKENRRTGAVLAEVYSSSTGRWSNTDSMPDLVFGYHFLWRADGDDDLAADRVGPCVYACREAKLLKLEDHVVPSLDSCKGYTLVNDRLLVLRYETRDQRIRTRLRPDVDGLMMISQFTLTEYQGLRNSPYWIRVRVHDCTPFERPFGMFPLSENFHMVLHACGDSLMITVMNNEYAAFRLVRIFLYDLSTYKWQEIPAVPGDEDQQPCIQAAMCELHWDAVP